MLVGNIDKCAWLSLTLVALDSRAVVRFHCDHVNRHIVPAFYKYLQVCRSDDLVDLLTHCFQRLKVKRPKRQAMNSTLKESTSSLSYLKKPKPMKWVLVQKRRVR